MTKVLFVTYLIGLTTCFISAYKQECAIGPSYWCKSFQNAQDCGALRHCTDTVWRYDEEHTNVDLSTKCEWCEKIIENTHKAIENIEQNQDLIKSTLINGCKLLPLEDISSKCIETIENYQTSVLSLMKYRRYNELCNLMNICPSEIEEKLTNNDEQSKILCNAVVRATQQLYIKEKKSRDDIELYLKNDCQKLETNQLREKCENFVEQRGKDIYVHVASNVESSKICDYIDDFSVQSTSQVHCDLCTVVLSISKKMLDEKYGEDEILNYIDEQICTRLNNKQKKSCKEIIDKNGRDFIDKIQRGLQPLLLCTHFQVCFDKILDETSPIQKNEMRSFLIDEICDKLGSLKSSCKALIEKDGNRLLQILVNDVNGNELCYIFGLCPKKSPLLDHKPVNDDPSQCKRCVKDLGRRKHIAERLINRSSEFLHLLCEQLPQSDDCLKTVDESTNNLITFIRSLDPRSICVELKMCDKKIKDEIQFDEINQSDNIIFEEVIEYIKNGVCPQMGSLSPLCIQLTDSEGLSLLNLVEKTIDPRRVCSIIDICPSNLALANCNNQCQCCLNKIEIYQNKLIKLLQTMVARTRILCDHVNGRDECFRLANMFESNVNKVFSYIDSKQTCQFLNFCTSTEKSNEDQCQTCKTELNIRQNNFRTTINAMKNAHHSFCKNVQCRLQIESTEKETLEKMNKIDSQTLCQRLGYCLKENSFEPSAISLRLRNLIQHQTKTFEQRLEANEICSEFGELKSICEHLISSPLSRRYSFIYMSLLTNNPKLVDDDLREQISTKLNTDVCDSCIDKVKLSKDFWLNSLDSIRDVLLRTCERCTEKDKCRDYYNKRFDNIKSYVNQIDPNQFCQAIHLCSSSSSLIHIKTDQCQMCVDSLQSRKDSLLKSIDRIVSYFDDICQRFGLKQCQVFVKQIQDSIEKSIESFQPKEFCTSIGFCSTINNNKNMDYQQFEKYLEDELDKNLCSTLGPFETLCKHIIHGNIKQVQTAKINYNIKDLMQIGEKFSNSNRYNMFSAANLNECDRDRCTCCINTIDQKKECAKSTIDRMIAGLIRTCDYCPSKDKCQEFWTSTQKRYDSYIDDIDSKQICTRIGYCNASKLCEKMGIFQQSCEEALAAFTQSIEHDKQPLENHLPHTSVVVLPTKSEEENVYDFNDSNSTCILCEYFMNILGKYIHQKSTEQEIEQSLGKVCDGMPSTLRKQCHDFIDNYGPAIIATLIHEFQPLAICRKLNLCTKEMNVELKHLTKANQGSCGVCDYVSTYINFALKRDSSEKSYQHALSTVCSHLSSERSSQCQTFVQLFASHFRKLNLQLGENFCQQLPMCQTPMSELKPAIHLHDIQLKQEPTIRNDDQLKQTIEKNLDATPQCMLCKYVITYLDTVLKTNKSEAAVEAALEKICKTLPNKKRPKCDEFIKTYGTVIVELIFQISDPNIICRYLGMCQVISSGEILTTKSTPITYSNHDYARIPV